MPWLLPEIIFTCMTHKIPKFTNICQASFHPSLVFSCPTINVPNRKKRVMIKLQSKKKHFNLNKKFLQGHAYKQLLHIYLTRYISMQILNEFITLLDHVLTSLHAIKISLRFISIKAFFFSKQNHNAFNSFIHSFNLKEQWVTFD